MTTDPNEAALNLWDEEAPARRHMYEVERLSMMGFTLWVGIHMDTLKEGQDRNALTLRTILQRDVAQEMGL